MIIWSCSPPDDEAIALAKAWVVQKCYTRDDVDMRRDSRSVYVQLKEGKEIK